jgi:tetratricopeptide (TPR) repeat protein
VGENLKRLFMLYVRPGAAMGEILDGGSLLFTSIALIAGTFAVLSGIPQARFSFYTPLLVLAVAYVPGTLLVAGLVGTWAGLATDFRRDYSPLLTASGMAWTAISLPLALAVRTTPASAFPVVLGAAALALSVLMFFAVRTVFGAGNGSAAAIVLLSWIPLAGVVAVWDSVMSVFHLLASPFFLFYAIYYLGGEFRGLGAGLRSQQNFRRMLEAAALNPHDGEAQYQLGLVHLKRRQTGEAMRRFQAAVKIDPTETDAHFQLGCMARQQGRPAEALAHLETVLKQDPKHRSNEIHRELGATYLALGRTEDAGRELAFYTDRREYDPEGLYYYGQALEALGKKPEAKAVYARAVDSARTAPHYRRHLVARWSRLAQRGMKRL